MTGLLCCTCLLGITFATEGDKVPTDESLKKAPLVVVTEEKAEEKKVEKVVVLDEKKEIAPVKSNVDPEIIALLTKVAEKEGFKLVPVSEEKPSMKLGLKAPTDDKKVGSLFTDVVDTGLGTLIQMAEFATKSINQKFVLKQMKMLEGITLDFWGIGLFAGQEAISSFIRKETESPWSHVGVVLKDIKTDVRYCLESTSGASEILQGIMPQVRITKLDEVVKSYEGGLGLREFKFTDEYKHDPLNVTRFTHEVIGRPYENQPFLELWHSMKAENKTEDESRLFCSELTALMLMKLGLMKTDTKSGIASNFIPKDFAENFDKEVHFNPGISLGAEQILKALKEKKGCCTIL
jgi:hypothetical protein